MYRKKNNSADYLPNTVLALSDKEIKHICWCVKAFLQGDVECNDEEFKTDIYNRSRY